MRTPRKLKKGCRTLHGNPRTKWQRRGQRQVIKVFTKIGHTAVASAIACNVLDQAISEFKKGMMVVGGITHPDARVQFPDRQQLPNRPLASNINVELVLDKEKHQDLDKILEMLPHLQKSDCVIPVDTLLRPESIQPLPSGKRLQIPPIKFKHD